ncbi:TfoX/Sxy family protein [Haloarchaeobius baliensis]|uniref:TfoX/Sxy family protein n=1 Tax=Haloarchaeobius baliensis TaxID=1670458 RepID=UPI003F884E90
MPYFDPDRGASLRTAFDALVADLSDVTATTMFGCPSYRADGTLFAVLVTDGVALTRLPDDRRGALAEQFETGPFDANGRTVTKWVQVAVDDVDELEQLRPYVVASYESALVG